jgi:hypothetical protein
MRRHDRRSDVASFDHGIEPISVMLFTGPPGRY